MEEFYFSVDLGNNRALCLAPLTERRRAAADQEIEDPSGYFLYERKGNGENADVEILAQVRTPEAALRLRELLRMD